VFYRRGLDILEQETIGAELGLRIPMRLKKHFSNRKIKFLEKSENGFGTQITKDDYSINNFFKKYRIPLEISDIFYANSTKELENLILEKMTEENDLILRFNNEVFQEERAVGHFAIIIGYDKAKKIISIGDPEPPFNKTLTLNDALYSISDKIDGTKRGLYVIKPLH
jgi:hypothetical protein